MKATQQIVRMNETESIIITKWSGGTSCSLVLNEDLDEGVSAIGKVAKKVFAERDKLGKVARATVNKVNELSKRRPKDLSTIRGDNVEKVLAREFKNEGSSSTFKIGDKVLYKDKEYTVKTPYVYKNDACLRLIGDDGSKKQVFERSVTLIKSK